MQEMIYMLILLPVLFAITLPFTSPRVRIVITSIYVMFLIFISLQVIFFQGDITTSFSPLFHTILTVIDFLVLGYFLYEGFKYKDKLVMGFAFVQIILFIVVLQLPSTFSSYDISIDYLAKVMLLVVNLVGGVIILYALKYIQSEDLKVCKKGLFIGILFFFIGVMNFTVTTNNIKLFFLAFELTTLCSYLLIRFRMDTIAIKNALQALWMNQIGGVAILISLIFSLTTFESYYFNILIENSAELYLAPMAFLVIASLVKGASLPLQNWLLGAMVAPTPVSAILHSATMVKIAPFLILKITPSFSETLSLTLTLFGSFVFLAASLLALSKDFFKEILGLSTIALLALMVAIGSIGTNESFMVVVFLIIFHALSKALLFFQAGILEKEFSLKYVSDIDGLIGHSKLVVFFILIGFASLTLPPFGAFIGKFITIEMLADLMTQNLLYLIPLVFILLGSVVLTLLYFKVLTKMLVSSTITKEKNRSLPLNYIITSFILVFLIFLGVFKLYTMTYISFYELLIPLSILVISFVLLMFSSYKKAHRVKEYHCGEKDSIIIQPFYFHINSKYLQVLQYIAIGFFMLIILIGVV